MLLPECGSAPSHLESILNSFSSFYLIKKLPLYELLDKDFLQSAVYQGNAPVSPVVPHTYLSHLSYLTLACLCLQAACTVCPSELGSTRITASL